MLRTVEAPVTSGRATCVLDWVGRGVAGASAMMLLTACSASDTTSGTPAGEANTDTISVEDQQAQLADMFGVADPPPVEVVRLVTPEENETLVESCLTEQGYSSTTMMEVGIPAEQTEAFSLARYICTARYPIDPAYTRTWSEDQVGIQYDWTVEQVIPCLAREGYTVSEPPSREVFIANWFTDPFYPFAQLAGESLSNEEWNALNDACPQTAPPDVLWADAD